MGKVENHFARFDQAGINYSPSMYDAIITVKKNDSGKMIIELSTEAPGIELFYTVDNSIPNHYNTRYTGTIEFPDGADNFRVISYRNGKQIGRLISLKTEELEKRVRK